MSRLRPGAYGYVPLQQLIAAPEFVPQAQRNQQEMNALLQEINVARRTNMPNRRNQEREMNALLREINAARRANMPTRKNRKGGKRRKNRKTRRS